MPATKQTRTREEAKQEAISELRKINNKRLMIELDKDRLVARLARTKTLTQKEIAQIWESHNLQFQIG